MLCGIGNHRQEGKYFLGQLFQVKTSARRCDEALTMRGHERRGHLLQMPHDGPAMQSCLVGCLVRSFQPRGKTGPRFIGQHLHSGKHALRLILAKFRIQERIIEAGPRGIGVARPVINDVDASPVAGRQAHGTGLATGVELTAFERESIQPFACRTNRIDFAVRRRVVRRCDSVYTFAHDPAIANNDRREWSARSRPRVFSLPTLSLGAGTPDWAERSSPTCSQPP